MPVSLVKGKNVLTATFEFSDSTDIENMFIMGNFGVKAGKVNKIVPLPEKLAFGNLCKQGLPFYMGDVTYKIALPGGKYRARVNDFYAACLKTREGVHAFAPFEFVTESQNGIVEITATLTPKNTFGPLHEIPAVLPVCGPGDWHTAEKAWSDDYSLMPQGIFSPPEFTEIKK